MTKPRASLSERLVTYKTAGYALLVVLGGAVLLWWSNVAWSDDTKAWQATVNQLGGLLIATGGLAILWDLRGKRDFMDEVLEKAKLASDVSAAGIARVTMKWMDIPWDELFSTAREIEVFISYGSSWRKLHWAKIEEFATDARNSLKLYLPDPDDLHTMTVLAQRYDYTPEKVKMSIIETAQEFAKLNESSKADIRIYYRSGDPTYTSYRFDDKILVTLYSHKRRRGDVPAIMVSKGTFGEFFMSDLESIRNQSQSLSLTALVKSEEK
jgi:hypothetical protein